MGEDHRPRGAGGAAVVTHAGAVATRRQDGERELLLVRSSRGREWVLPKGHIERGESVEEAALRELREEAGVAGRIIRPLGVRAFRSVRVAFFVVEATGTVETSESREPRWCTIEEALALSPFEETRQLLLDAAREVGP